jgi:hypothetical protein
MTVYSKDGQKLGKIIRRDGEDLIIQKGLLNKQEHVASLDDVARVEGEVVWLRQTAAELEGPPQEEDEDARTRASGETPRDAESIAAGHEEVVVVFEEEVVLELPPDDEPAGVQSPGRTPNGRH